MISLGSRTPPDIPPLPPLTPDDTSPEALKERYFPNHPSEPEKLAWLQSTPPSNDASIRFDLSGLVIASTDRLSIPTSKGLHHHGTSPDLAGYTIDDVLWLCRSTVVGQRVSMMEVLARILGRYGHPGGDAEVQTVLQQKGAWQKGLEMGTEVVQGPVKSLSLLRAGVELLFEALGGSHWRLGGIDIKIQSNSTEAVGIAAVPFLDLLPGLKDLASPQTGLPARTVQQIVLILHRAVRETQALADIVDPLIAPLTRNYVLARPWPLEMPDYPSTDVLRLLLDSISASRVCAQSAVDSGIIDSLCRFLIPSTWPDDSTIRVAYELVDLTLQILAALGRYGLAAATATSSLEIFVSLGAWVTSHLEVAVTPLESKLMAAYFACLRVWTVCAIDPHRTTPEHALTWAQISALGWEDEALNAITILAKDGKSRTALRCALGLVVSWLEGVEINGANRGATEKQAVWDRLSSSALEGFKALLCLSEEAVSGGHLEIATELLKLNAMLAPLHTGNHALLRPDIKARLVRHAFDRTYSPSAVGSVLVTLQFYILHLDLSDPEEPALWTKRASELMSKFLPGQEPLALLLTDDLLNRKWTSSTASQYAIHASHADGLVLLRPLLQYAILPDVRRILAPASPSHLYLKATTSLRYRSTPSNTEGQRAPGLPLRPDWLFSPLDELLRSATSTALAQTPPDWDPSEVEVVQATLYLALICLGVAPEAINRSLIILNLMKVFMLEKDQDATSPSPEVFRDDGVSALLKAIIAPLTLPETSIPSPTSASTTPDTLETAANAFLGPDVPFFQFYTDFLALFEAISFSDPVFTQLVLPPLAMTYPVDYRKLLWVDHPTALRSIRTSLRDMPLEHGRVEVYFTPKEEDKDVLAGYTRALLNGWVVKDRQEFLWTIAVHHLASLMWDEEGKDGQESKAEGERASVRKSLMTALVNSPNVIRALLEVDVEQSGGDRTVGGAAVQRRLSTIEQVCGVGTRGKVADMLA